MGIDCRPRVVAWPEAERIEGGVRAEVSAIGLFGNRVRTRGTGLRGGAVGQGSIVDERERSSGLSPERWWRSLRRNDFDNA
jgi:hypothetical protein